jgi:hypothetical protein
MNNYKIITTDGQEFILAAESSDLAIDKLKEMLSVEELSGDISVI